MLKPAFTYSTSAKRYRNSESGQFVGRVEVRKELDSWVDVSSQRMSDWTSELRDGDIDIEDWQLLMAEEIKNVQITFSTAANGGWDSMTEEDYSRVEEYTQEQYDYLQSFAEQIYTGEVVLDGRALYRSGLYAESGRVTYEKERFILEEKSGATEERNILGGSDHCSNCLEMTDYEWVPIGTLTSVGDRQCGPKCHCTVVYRTGPNDKLGSELESF